MYFYLTQHTHKMLFQHLNIRRIIGNVFHSFLPSLWNLVCILHLQHVSIWTRHSSQAQQPPVVGGYCTSLHRSKTWIWSDRSWTRTVPWHLTTLKIQSPNDSLRHEKPPLACATKLSTSLCPENTLKSLTVPTARLPRSRLPQRLLSYLSEDLLYNLQHPFSQHNFTITPSLGAPLCFQTDHLPKMGVPQGRGPAWSSVLSTQQLLCNHLLNYWVKKAPLPIRP